MKDWMKSKFLETLAGKLTAILAFAILLIAILALLGAQIEDRWLPLVYIVAILAMIIFTYEIFAKNKPSSEEKDAKDLEAVNEDIKSRETVTPKPERSIEKPSISFLDAKKKYLQQLIREYMPLSLNVYPTHSGDPKGRLALEDIYIVLNTTTQVEKAEQRKSRKENKPEEAVLGILD